MRRAKRGFTLVELMIVVAVIAILAIVVVPTFFRDSNKVKSTSEVTPVMTEMTNKIEQYKSETGRYVNGSTLENGTPVVCPSAPSRAGIDPFSETCGAVWTLLRIAPPQPKLRCSYELQVGEAGETYSGSLPTGITFTAPASTGWWTILATCDADGQGTSSTNGKFFMSSIDSTLQKVNEAY
jgi:prepilin-type N-terminal cleavage/methylation domain-containing protein